MSSSQAHADAAALATATTTIATTATITNMTLTMSSLSSSSSTNTNNNNKSTNSTEQPQTKRQKIEKLKTNCSKVLKTSTTARTTAASTKTPPPDVIDTGEHVDVNGSGAKHLCSSLSSSAHSISAPSSSNNSPTSTPSSSRTTSLSQLLNVQNIASILPTTTTGAATFDIAGTVSNIVTTAPLCASASHNNNHHISDNSSFSSSADEVDRIALPDLLPVGVNECSGKLKSSSSMTTAMASNECSTAQDMREFEESLTKQCLCGVSERTLRKPFQSHYSLDAYGQKRIANLSEWPTNKLLQFLSNLQLLFDIYLKQNSKGFICARIMDVCDALIRNDHNLIDEIIVLAGYSNSYVQFLAGRVLASFLVITKQEMDDDWLKKLVDNLFNFNRLDHVAVQKIHFSLEIIKRIVEWKDIDLHPLEDEITDTTPSSSSASATATAEAQTVNSDLQSHTCMHFQTQQPTLETNYFAVHFGSDGADTEDVENENDVRHEAAHSRQEVNDHQHSDMSIQMANYGSLNGAHVHSVDMSNAFSVHHHNAEQRHFATIQPHFPPLYQAAPASSSPGVSFSNAHFDSMTHFVNDATTLLSGCHIITLTDSESFDTTHLKCITIKILENKWPALVKNMSALIANHLDIENAENCILDFLQLWENIISVKANLSIVETLPFYAQLDKFELLLNQSLSCTVYKQMLCLFNEALCYGSTLALQDMLPGETCMLAHQIVRHVKDFRILESLPRRQPENIVSLIGFKQRPIIYAEGSLQTHYAPQTTSPLAGGDVIEMDKTILQKMVLLVLKSIAVTVKEIRSDSSDSSIDSTDNDAFQDMVLIERSIRDVLCKLESFIKHTLEFHPECHFSKILIHLFDDQDDHLIEAMVCTLDVTAGISFRNNAFPELVTMLNPVYTFLEFLKMISNSSDLLLDLLVSNETCFLLYLLRFLKYIRMNWAMFVQSCHDFGMGANTLDEAMSVLIRLRLQISRLVSRQLYPYDISPVLRLLESCESLFEGNELS